MNTKTALGVAGVVGLLEDVFNELAEGARNCISLGAPSHTEALEFDDGKVMLGNLEPMDA